MIINVKTEKSCDIIIEAGFGGLARHIKELFPLASVFLITDENVSQIYAKPLIEAISPVCKSVSLLTIPPGENSKNIETLSILYDFLLKEGADRNSVIIALGGGVVGDIAGFAAATYMRGIPYIQLPTTLLAQVDSSIGGKTAIDFAGYKNLVGAFYQPNLVYINIETLETLPKRQFANGAAEVLKYGLIFDKSFLGYVEENIEKLREYSVLTHIIASCVRLKASVVEKDELDKGLRELLNFGHTIGHAVEALKGFQLLHGECVAIGTVAAMEISCGRGALPKSAIKRYKSLLRKLELPESVSGISASEIYEAAKKDKKAKSGRLTFVLLECVGKAASYADVSQDEIMLAIKKITEEV